MPETAQAPQQTTPPDDLLTTARVAEMLGTSSRHVQMQTETGRLPYFATRGGHRHVSQADVVSAVQRSGITSFTAGDRLISLSQAAQMCVVSPKRVIDAAQAAGIQFASTLGAEGKKGHRRLMERDLPRIRQQILQPDTV